MPVHVNKPAGSLSAKRAVAILLLTAASMLALGACTNSGRDYLNERPSSNYQRLPVR